MNYTTIEQSEHLLELGLSPKTADMFYSRRPTGNSEYSTFPDFKPEGRLEVFTKVDLPCWSVGALLEVMPKLGVYPTFDLDKENPSIFYLNDGTYQDEVVFGSTLLETAFNMVVWLLENNYIKRFDNI